MLGVGFLAEFSTGSVVPFLIGVVILGYVLFQVGQGFVADLLTAYRLWLGSVIAVVTIVGLLVGSTYGDSG